MNRHSGAAFGVEMTWAFVGLFVSYAKYEAAHVDPFQANAYSPDAWFGPAKLHAPRLPTGSNRTMHLESTTIETPSHPAFAAPTLASTSVLPAYDAPNTYPGRGLAGGGLVVAGGLAVGLTVGLTVGLAVGAIVGGTTPLA